MGIMISSQPTFNSSRKELNSLVEYLKTIPSKKETKELVKTETNVIYDGDLNGKHVLIVKPLSYRSSCYYGQTTRWCTASKKTEGNFNSITKDGELLYIIFEGDLKYAILFKKNDNIEVYNAADQIVPTEEFLTQFPSIRTVLKEFFQKPIYDLLLELYNSVPDLTSNDNFDRLIEKINVKDKSLYISPNEFKYLLQGRIILDFKFEDLVRLFVDEYDEHDIIEAFEGGYSDREILDYDSASTDFDDGRVFSFFTEHDLDKLLEYFKLSDTAGYIMVNEIIKSDPAKRRDYYEDLANIFDKTIHEKLRDDIIDEYHTAHNKASIAGGMDEIKKDFKNEIKTFFNTICTDEVIYLSDIESINFTIADILRWYQNGDEELPESSPRKNYSILEMINEYDPKGNFGMYEVSNAYYENFDQDEFDDKFNVDYSIGYAIDKLEEDPEIIERIEYMEQEENKLNAAGIYVGESYNVPRSNYVISVHYLSRETGKVNVTIGDSESDKVKQGFITAERLINLTQMEPLTDIINEVYNLFKGLINTH